MGYKRPSMIIDEHIDEIVEGRTLGGFLRAPLSLSESDRVPPFFKVKQVKRNPKLLADWLEKIPSRRGYVHVELHERMDVRAVHCRTHFAFCRADKYGA